MLFVEKKDNIQTLISFGADQRSVFNIFFIEGLLISGKGVIIGLLLGYGICILQLKSALLTMPNSGGEPFPIDLSLSDGLLILFLVSILSVLFSYLPVRFLLKKNFGHLRF
jgi:lipoprotein-releasing system permease protein